MKKNSDVLVVGAGIVGLASALRLKQFRPKTRLILIEKETDVAQHQTSRNSGVIHSGLYYKPNSLKALNCLAGYKELINFCQIHSIPYDICGKIVVATSVKELERLDDLYRRGLANGLKGLRFLNSKEIQEIEPHCSGVRGLLVPQTGIVDFSVVAKKYAELLTNMGVEIIFGERVINLKNQNNKVEVITDSSSWVGNVAIVCAGVYADRLAQKSEANLPLRILPFRGEYYKFTASAPKLVNHLIYPVPDPNFPFLGVHFTRMIQGGIECGPNAVFAFGREAYNKTDFNLRDLYEAIAWKGFRVVAKKYWRNGFEEYYRSFSKQAFVNALQKLIPEVQAAYLEPGAAGVRAQACDYQGNLLDDFNIRKNGNIINVCNAPSPAATASLAIGNTISKIALSLY